MKATSKLLTLLALILLSSISAISINAENRFYIDDFTISSGETKELAINLTNDVAFTGFQADIYLPEGLEVEQEDGEYIFDLTDRKGRDHTLSAERQNNGAIRILSYSVKLKEFSGTSGALVNFNVTASDDFSGNYQIQIKNITFATADQTGVDFESTVCNVVGKCLAESITLNMTEASLKVNETTTLTATVLPETATNKSVTWTSSNESVATVDADGVVTAIAAGEATITATTVDGSNLSASCKVTVESGSTGLPISVTPASGSTVGELQKIVFEFSAADYPNTMDYDSTKSPVLYNAAGEEVAIGHMGYADAVYMSLYVQFDAPITAEGVYTLKVPEGAMREYPWGVDNPMVCPAMELTYTIIPVKAESISVDKTEVEIIAGETEFLTVTILPETTSNKTVVWSSSDEEVAVVNEYGVVTALAVGEATITATTTDGSNLSASCQVTVVAALAESISLNMTEASIEVSRTTTLTATVLPENTTDKSVTWSSSNESVATVDANGLVTAIAVGEATITATTTDGSNLSASCLVTVEALRGFPILVTPASGSTVNELQRIVFEFSAADYPNSMEFDSGKSPVLYNAAGEEVAIGSMGFEDVVTYMSIYVSFDAPITAEGVYTLKVPEGAMREYGYGIENPRNCPALELTYTVKADDTTNLGAFPITISPAAGSTVGELQKIVFEFSAADYPNSMSYDPTKSPVLYNAAGEEVAIGHMGYEDAAMFMSVYVTFDTPITTEGVYTLKVPEGAMYEYGVENPKLCPAMELTYTIIPIKAESITLDKTEVEIIVGETEFLTATVFPETTSNMDIVWTSSDEEIAVVNEYGVVTAIAVGEATITATTADGSNLSASCQVTVVAALAESITLNMTEVSLEVSETTTLTATVLPETVTNKSVTWTSSNESVATVDANGLVTAIAVGEATITATTTDGSNLSASCVVTVEALRGFPISITPEDGSTVGELQKIVFEFSAADYPNTMEYDSSKNPILYNAAGEEVAEGHMGYEDAATFMSIYVTFDAPITAEGVYTLKVPAGAMREYGYGIENPRNCPAMELTYNIMSVKAESITLDKTEVEIIIGESDFLTATILPETASNKDIVWTSSDEEIAVVNEYGVVTAIALGEAVITATTTDGSDLSASCKVTVVPVLAMSIELDKTELDAMEMTEFQLNATVLPENTTNKGVVWTSSDNEIASVDETGLVKMLRVGSVVITATTVDGSNLSASCHITIVVGIDDVEGDNVIVATIGNNIVVKNAQLGSNVRVYAADGSIITSEIATDGDVVIEAPVKGIYIVAIDGKSFKVMVK